MSLTSDDQTPADPNEETDETPADSRRGARQTALQALYWATSTTEAPQQAVRELSRRFRHSEENTAFAASLVRAVCEHRTELDQMIAAAGARWTLDRMARLDALILRLALAEILHITGVPVRVSIYEAVELARLYSTANSYAFVNGVLDAIVRQHGIEA